MRLKPTSVVTICTFLFSNSGWEEPYFDLLLWLEVAHSRVCGRIQIRRKQGEMARVTYRRIWPLKLLAFVGVVCLIGCSSHVAPLDPNRTRNLLPFIIEARTTKEEILIRLGTPVNQYENGRILTYILSEDPNGRLKLGFTSDAEVYNLVLVFGPTEILEKYSLLRVQ
jgi:hypothetical protein